MKLKDMTFKRGHTRDDKGPQWWFCILFKKGSWLFAFRPRYWSLRKVPKVAGVRQYVGPFEFQVLK